MTRSVLALCAHPDDAEFRCGGTLLRLAGLGWAVHVATLSSGDCGSAEEAPGVIAARRVAEGHAAAQQLGGTFQCLGGQDLQVYDDQTMRAAAVALLRRVNPDIVLTHYPVDYMPDHEAASAVARVAVFTAPIPNYVVGPAASEPAMSRMAHLYYFGSPMGGVDYFGAPVRPSFLVEITAQAEAKAAALACHASQREWLWRHHGMDQYLAEMHAWDAEMGALIGVPAAEGFTQHLGHAFPHSPLLQETLGAVKPGSGHPRQPASSGQSVLR